MHELVLQLDSHESRFVQDVLLTHKITVEQQHWARHMPQASVAMDEHAELMAPQPTVVEVVQVPTVQERPVLQVPLS